MKTFIREEAIRQGVDPELMLRLAQVESNYNPKAKSNKNAYGMMQITPIAAKEMGVNRKDPYDNIRGGIGYFKKQLDAFGGDTEKALAAYNAGASKVKKYDGVPPYPETQQYVSKIMDNRNGSDIFVKKTDNKNGAGIFTSNRTGSGADIFTPKNQEVPIEKSVTTGPSQQSISAKLLGSSPVGFAGRTALGAANLALLEPLQLGINIGDKIGNTPIVKKPLMAIMEALNVPVVEGEVLSPKEKINNLMSQLESYKKEGGHKGFDWGGLLGGIGMGVKGLSATPGASQLGTKLQNYITSTPATVKGRIGQGAAIGTLLGRSPVTNENEGYFEQKIPQVGLGALVGGAIPGVIGGTSKTIDFIKRVKGLSTPEGIDNITATILKQAAGEDIDVIIKLLDRHKDYIVGSKSTVGEYTAPANNPRFAGLQKIVAPHSSNSYYNIAHSKKEAINNILDSIAKTPDDLEAAISLRGRTSKPFYDAAKKSNNEIDTGVISRDIENVLKFNKYTDDVAIPLKDIQSRLLEINSSGNKPRDLISLSDNIQKQIKDTKENGTPLYNVKVLTNIKTQLDDRIKNRVPAHAEAEAVHRGLSDPIDRMKVGQYFKDKLIAPLADDGNGADAIYRSNAYAQAMRDAPKTVERATGFYTDIRDVFKNSPEELLQLKSIQRDLARKAKYEELSSYGKVEAQDLIDNIFPKIPSIGMFSALYSMARAGVSNVENSALNKALSNLGQILENDPGKVAYLMSRLPPVEKQKLLIKLLDAKAMKVTPGKTASQYLQEQQ